MSYVHLTDPNSDSIDSVESIHSENYNSLSSNNSNISVNQSKLLLILKSEGLDVPTCATTLLGTDRITFDPIISMTSHIEANR
ncbi:hypothetical protein PV325_000181, partial [Microctonus aethiopoides]